MECGVDGCVEMSISATIATAAIEAIVTNVVMKSVIALQLVTCAVLHRLCCLDVVIWRSMSHEIKIILVIGINATDIATCVAAVAAAVAIIGNRLYITVVTIQFLLLFLSRRGRRS